MKLRHQYYRPMVPRPRPMLSGYPLAASLLAPKKGRSNPQGNWSNANGLLSPAPYLNWSPVLVQMTVVHEPSLQLLQFSAHLTPLLGKAPRFCALLFGELAMLGSSLSESRKAVLGPRAGGSPLHGAYSAPQGVWRDAYMAYPCAFGPRTSDLASLGRKAMVWD